MWWTGKSVKATLPYLLAALELLAEFSSAHGTAQGLWIDGASFMNHSNLLTSTERELWKSTGLHLGFDQGTVAEYLEVQGTPFQGEDPTDIFATSNLKKVAIGSLHEKSAEAAADLIRQRSWGRSDHRERPCCWRRDSERPVGRRCARGLGQLRNIRCIERSTKLETNSHMFRGQGQVAFFSHSSVGW